MKVSIIYLLTIVNVVFATSAVCAERLSQEQVLKQNKPIAELRDRLKKANENELQLLAPDGLERAQNKYGDALNAAQKGKAARVKEYVEKATKLLEKAELDAVTSKRVMAEVLKMRGRAQDVGADKLYEKEFMLIEKSFAKAAKLIERSKVTGAKKKQGKLLEAYSSIELKALKTNTIQPIAAALVRAEKVRANKWAPKTLRRAKDDLAQILSILDTDRTQVKKANAKAKRATQFAERSVQITLFLKAYDQADSTLEDLVLWHQRGLSILARPLGKELAFTETDKSTINTLSNVIGELKGSEADAQRRLGLAEKRIEKMMGDNDNRLVELQQSLDQKMAESEAQFQRELSLQTNLTDEVIYQQTLNESRYTNIQNMFSNDEAAVYRQQKNVLLSVYGISFASGKSIVESKNFPLINKVIDAILEFQGARVEVSGHTDSVGSSTTNLALSKSRAKNVARFISKVGDIDEKRITYIGYGHKKPIASNETAEGRARNRRIEVLILVE